MYFLCLYCHPNDQLYKVGSYGEDNNLRNVVSVDVCGVGGPSYQAIQLAFQHCFELPADCEVYHEVGRGVDHEEQVADSDEDEEPFRGLTTDCVDNI